MALRVYVGNLPPETREEDLEDLFHKVRARAARLHRPPSRRAVDPFARKNKASASGSSRRRRRPFRRRRRSPSHRRPLRLPRLPLRAHQTT